MSILTDHEIDKLSIKEVKYNMPDGWMPMIEPFFSTQVKKEIIKIDDPDVRGEQVAYKPVISYGCSSHGYDIRIGNKFKIFSNINSTVVDPKNFSADNFVDFEGDVCIIPPNSFVLASSMEYFNMPDDVSGLVLGKSTYARCGISCLATPLEPGWSGNVTLEFANTTPLPVMLYANEGAAQVQFHKSNSRPDVTYADRGGKYQDQVGITLPKV